MNPDASARFCPFCGKPVSVPETAYCFSCGRALVTTQQAPSAAVHPAQLGMGVPAMPAPTISNAGRMIGVMLGLVGVLLVLTGARVYITAYLLRLFGIGFFGYLVLLAVSPGIALLVLVVPLCYWLALLRLRAVSLARIIPEVLATSLALAFARVLITDLYVLLFLRGAATRLHLTGIDLFLGVILPVVVGAVVGVGAALLFTRWGEIPKLSTQTSSRTVLHLTLILGSFVGFALLEGLLYYLIFTATRGRITSHIMLDMGNIVVQGAFAVSVVIGVSIWMRQTLRVAYPYHGAVPPLSPSDRPMAASQQEPAQQTPPTETQA